MVLEGEVKAGQPYVQALGGGIEFVLQPIHSGWILRVVPEGTPAGQIGGAGFQDYAELATPPYQSVTPLSISTDFSFRAQDAVGWNPRRFRYAASAEAYGKLKGAYDLFERSTGAAKAAAERSLAAEVARAPDGIFRIVDAKLEPGTADQWQAAAAVSENFTMTAHTIVLAKKGESSALGKLLAFRFRVEMEVAPGFVVKRGVKVLPHVCGSR